MRGHTRSAMVALAVSVAAFPATTPAQASSVRAIMYGAWGMACPRGMGRNRQSSCMIHYRAGNRPGYEINWEVYLDDSGTSRLASRGWSRTTCQPISLSEEVGRYYRLTDESIPVWRMEDHARRLLAAMRSHIPSFGDCQRQRAYSEAFPETLLNGQEAGLTRALIAAETELRGRGPDRNEGVTTTANLNHVEFRGSRASLDRIEATAVARGWRADGRNADYMAMMLPDNYQPNRFDALAAEIDRLGLNDIEIWLIGHYGPTRVRR